MNPMRVIIVILSLTTLSHAQGPLLHWDFDGGVAQDKSGNGNHGNIQGATIAPGILGDSLHFDGVNDYVWVFAATNLSTFTYNAWIFPESFGDREIFSKSGSSGGCQDSCRLF